jgi:hypothetical protein
MAKADFSRDYYGDLEIQPTADIAEIKKQFKKLGMCDFLSGSLPCFGSWGDCFSY